MNISSDNIQAFLEVTRKKNISRAAESLGLTQAALSIRIRKLEEELEKTLFLRSRTGIELTPAGREFQAFAENFIILCDEFKTRKPGQKLRGELKIACFSTVGRSLVLPALKDFLSQNDGVEFSIQIREIRELSSLLQSGEADIILMDRALGKSGTEEIFLGNEEYVFVTGKKKPEQHIYLNHDEDDLMTFRYYEKLGQKKETLKRRYLDEIYAVLDGVAVGIGVSVLPIHLARERKDILVPTPNKKLLSPVYLTYKKRPFYPPVLKAALNILEEELKSRLKS